MINEVIKKNGITYGIILGVVLALITATMYAIDLKLFVSGWITAVKVVIYLTISILVLSKTKKELGNIFPFKSAFTTSFITVLVGILIATLFDIILFNFVDPGAKETLSDIVIKSTVEFMQKLGTPASAINDAIAKMKETNNFDTLQIIKGTIFVIIIGAVFSLIMAAFFKSKTTQE